MINIGESLKEAAMAIWNSKEIDKPQLTLDLSKDGRRRLEVTLSGKASIDLPGEMDSMIVTSAGMVGLGNSPSSGEQPSA